MKKIVVVLDGLNYSSSAVAYAVFIAQQEMAHLVGVFPEDFTYRSYALYDLIASGRYPAIIAGMPALYNTL